MMNPCTSICEPAEHRNVCDKGTRLCSRVNLHLYEINVKMSKKFILNEGASPNINSDGKGYYANS